MSDAVLEAFLAHCASLGLELYPEQEEAVLELFAGRSVILNTPTGSGKSLVAAAFHRLALARGELSVYTCPIKALVNEKFLALCREFGPENVGMMTGDATVNARAPILCCTAEILANQALARGPAHPVRAVIMDEFHYYGDEERGVSWQVPLLTLPQARFLLMSATLGQTDWIEREVAARTGAPCITVRGDNRPVPLAYEWSETPLAERVAGLLQENKAPVYLVHFTQRAASDSAQALMSQTLCTRAEKEAIAEALVDERFASPYGKDLRRWLRHGVGVHHAGLLPRYRVQVEKLAQRGLLKVICGTDTLGVGINVPIRTVVFTQLWKFDGRKAAVLSVRDFRQIAGRAGRRGYDTVGHVVAQAPEHVIENRRAEEKAAGDAKKLRKLVKAKPREGEISWDENTFVRLRTAPSEGLVSRFRLTAGMLLLALSRPDGCSAVKRLIAECHETPAAKLVLRRRALELFRALVERGIVGLRKPGEPGPKVRLNVELQDDFSLHQGLSLFLIDTLPLLDPQAPDHALDVLTLCEAIVEDPEPILRAQVSREKSLKLEELKAQGVPYEERLAKLEEVEHPKPRREFFYEAFNAWAAAHPWIDGENLHLKSIAREMFEGFRSFNDYIRDHGLERVEGLLLRHLSQTWKVLAQTVPDAFKTPAVLDIELYLREIVKGVDASLLEEWERLRDPDYKPGTPETSPRPAAPIDITRDRPAFLRAVRHAIHAFLADIQRRDWHAAAARLADSGEPPAEGLPWPAARALETQFAPYFEAHGRLRLDPAGRAAENTLVEEDGPLWHITQVLVDPDATHDWHLTLTLDLPASRTTPTLKTPTLHHTPIDPTPPAPSD